MADAETNRIIQELVRRLGVQAEYDDQRRRNRSGRRGGNVSQQTLFDQPKPVDEVRNLKGYGPERLNAVRKRTNQSELFLADPQHNPFTDPNVVETSMARTIRDNPGITDEWELSGLAADRARSGAANATQSRINDMLARSNMSDDQLARVLGNVKDPLTGDLYLSPAWTVRGDVEATGGYHKIAEPMSVKGTRVHQGGINATLGRLPGKSAIRNEEVLMHELGHEWSHRAGGPGGTRQEMWDLLTNTPVTDAATQHAHLAEVMGTEEGKADAFRMKHLTRWRPPGRAKAVPVPYSSDFVRAYTPENYFGPEGSVSRYLTLTPTENARADEVFRRAWGEAIARGNPKAVNHILAYQQFPPDVQPGAKFNAVLAAQDAAIDAQPLQMRMVAKNIQGQEAPVRWLSGEGGFVGPKTAAAGAVGLLAPIAANALGNKVGGDKGEVIRNAGLGGGLLAAGGPKAALAGAGIAALGTILKQRLQDQ